VLIGQGQTMGQVTKQRGVTEQTYFRGAVAITRVSESVQFLICYSSFVPTFGSPDSFRECAIPDLLLFDLNQHFIALVFPGSGALAAGR